MPDITKLPKWAQQRIERLEREAEYKDAQLAQIAGDKPSPVGLRIPGLEYSEVKPIPASTDVVFSLSPFSSVSVRLRDGAVEVMASGGSLFMQPQASNVVLLKMEGR